MTRSQFIVALLVLALAFAIGVSIGRHIGKAHCLDADVVIT